MSYQGTVKNYEQAAGGVGIGAQRIYRFPDNTLAVYANFAALQTAFQGLEKPGRGYVAVVGTKNAQEHLTRLDVAYQWNEDENRWDDIATNLKGNDGDPGIKGDKGTPGAGFNWQGTYDNATVYAPGHVVQWVNPADNTIGIYHRTSGTSRGVIPSTTANWENYIIAARPAGKKNPTFKAEARFTTTPANAQHMNPGTTVSQIDIAWDIVEKSAHDEVITAVDLTFNTQSPAGVLNIQNANNRYTYQPQAPISQPAFNSDVVATLTIRTNKNNEAKFTHTLSWKINWLKGYLDQTAAGLTVAQAGLFQSESGNDMPKSVRINRAGQTEARVFLLVEVINHKTLPLNFHLDFFPYLHFVNGKILTVNGRNYQVYASTQKTHANDLTVVAAYG